MSAGSPVSCMNNSEEDRLGVWQETGHAAGTTAHATGGAVEAASGLREITGGLETVTARSGPAEAAAPASDGRPTAKSPPSPS